MKLSWKVSCYKLLGIQTLLIMLTGYFLFSLGPYMRPFYVDMQANSTPATGACWKKTIMHAGLNHMAFKQQYCLQGMLTS